MSDLQNHIISSRFVKEIAQHKGDLKKFTTKSTIKSLKDKIPVSGTAIRNALINNIPISEKFMRPEIVNSIKGKEIFINDEDSCHIRLKNKTATIRQPFWVTLISIRIH